MCSVPMHSVYMYAYVYVYVCVCIVTCWWCAVVW
jgi:hypothetical protein